MNYFSCAICKSIHFVLEAKQILIDGETKDVCPRCQRKLTELVEIV